MNTFTARPSDIRNRYLSDTEIAEVRAAVRKALDDKKQVSIQIGFVDVSYYDEDEEYVEDTDYYLYGVYTMTDKEVDDYYQSGGMWSYDNPSLFLGE